MTRFGADGSHHQDGRWLTDADWRDVDFAIWRCSIGTRTDRTFAAKLAEARARRTRFCAYHIVMPTGELPTSLQATAVEDAIGRSVPVMLEWEKEVWTRDGQVVREFLPTLYHCLNVADTLRALGHQVPSTPGSAIRSRRVLRRRPVTDSNSRTPATATRSRPTCS